MNMTINRSIDFTKASSGIKLKPSIESVNFSETMKWAVGCLQSHAKVPIVVVPIPQSIPNQLYTDKQWLMENILCLLSNAQKFTTEGEITVRCLLKAPAGSQVDFKPMSIRDLNILDIEAGTTTSTDSCHQVAVFSG